VSYYFGIMRIYFILLACFMPAATYSSMLPQSVEGDETCKDDSGRA